MCLFEIWFLLYLSFMLPQVLLFLLNLYIIILIPLCFFFRTPRSSFLCLIVSSSLTTSPSLWLSDPTHSIESQLKTMKILLKQWKVTLGSYNKIDSHHTILVLCVYFLWYLCFPSLNTLYCYTFLPFFSWLMLQITLLPFTPWHQYPFSPYCSLYISQGADKKNLVKNQECQSYHCDHFLYSHDTNVWFRGDILGRNWMQRVKSHL